MFRVLSFVLAAVLLAACQSPVAFTEKGKGVPSARAFTGTTYYVSTTGSDTTGNGTAGAPWKSLSYAAAHVPANQGNGILLSAGTFTETAGTTLPTGVSIAGAGTTQTTLIYNGPALGWFINLESGSHVNGNQSIVNLTLDGNNSLAQKGIRVVGRDNVTIDSLKLLNFDDTAIQVIAQDVTGKPAFTLTGLVINSNSIINSAKDYSGFSSGTITISGLTGALITNNGIWEDEGYGIKFGQSWGDFYGIKIQNNFIQVPTVDGLWGADCGIEIWNAFNSSEISGNTLNTWMSLVNKADSAGVTSYLVHDNRIVNTNANNPKEGIELAASDAKVYNNYVEQTRWGLAMWQEKSVNNLVYNNVFYNPLPNNQGYVAGIYFYPQNGNMGNHKIYNNVIDGFEHGVWMKGFAANLLQNLEFKNNIFQNLAFDALWVSEGTAYIQTVTLANNLSSNVPAFWNGTVTGLTETGTLANTYPALTNSGARPNPYYVPASGSVAIDAGVNVGLPFTGAAPDIGAFESNGSGSSTVLSPTLTLPAGTYTGAQTVVLATGTPGASIRYTTDGSTPTSTTGTLYSSAIPIPSTLTLKALAFKSGSPDSPLVTVSYVIVAGAPYLGSNVVGSSSAAVGMGYLNGNRHTAASSMTVTKITAYIQTPAAGKIKAALYRDSAGSPGTLLKRTVERTNLGTGWQDFTLISSTALTAGTVYWIVLWSDDATYRVAATNGFGTNAYRGVTYSSTWPSSFGTPNGTNVLTMSLYAQ